MQARKTSPLIDFDSTSWCSIEDTIKKINAQGEMQFGRTDNGELIVFDVQKDENGRDCLVTNVFQDNGWIRKNIYNPETLMCEELYRRDEDDRTTK